MNPTFTKWNDPRNVVDEFKGVPTEQIKQILQDRANPFSVLMEHWVGDFNISTLIRNANAFGAKTIYYVGKRQYDKRGTVGTHHYCDIRHVRDISDVERLKEQYKIVVVDNIPGAVQIEGFKWPKNALMVFGEEGVGVTPAMARMADYVVSITQYGSVRSLNCGTASGIAMYDYTSKLRAEATNL
jgi:tRNA G18 (ribose-2'-O)-methylase SpoU